MNPSRGIHSAGIGVAAEGGGDVDWLEPVPGSIAVPGPWFGGWPFDGEGWAGFGGEKWVLPDILAFWDGKRTHLAAFGPPGSCVSELEHKLAQVEEASAICAGPGISRIESNRPLWDEQVAAALSEIERGTFEKVVLARHVDVYCDEELVERSLLKTLEARYPTCWTFLVRGRDGRAFIGASPETLCEVQGHRVNADALAGTAPPGRGHLLLDSTKARLEHQYVVNDVRDRLGRTCLDVYAPHVPSVRRLPNVEHLATPIGGLLRPGHHPLAVARALHPTAAVGGFPRSEALAWLKRHERCDRGWYSGAVGAMSESTLTLAVAIRSALLSRRTARVFVGAGIVEGSRANDEWEETSQKAFVMLSALGAANG
jgi:salicylate biosynthesis isochorismate synthase/menaquinone-specific isochorismate synthase